MGDFELKSGVDIENEIAIYFVESLPRIFPKDVSTFNYRIYGSPAEQVNYTVTDTNEVQKQSRVTKADRIDTLKELSKFVGVVKREGESIEVLRKRTLANFQNVTSEGTIADILESASFILEVSKDKIEYVENPTPGVVQLNIPSQAIKNSPLSQTEIISILGQNIAAGYKLQIKNSGTFFYVTPTDYDGGNYDPSEGYAGLDIDGNVTSGGTYSSVL